MMISFINPNFQGGNGNCTQVCGTNITCQDKGNATSKVTLKNNQDFEILKHTVDGCLIQDNQEKCDFLLEIKKPLLEDKVNSTDVKDYIYYEYYIEVKGSNLKKAYEQILATLVLSKTVSVCMSAGQHQRKGFISCTRIPKIDTTIQNLMNRAKREKIDITHKSGILEITDFKK